jgi:hypothetical protein
MEKEKVKKENEKTKKNVSKTPKPKNLVSAVLQVMNEVTGIEKNLTVGKGNFAYQGVSDKDVKKIVGDAMYRAGLIILPIGVNPETKIERWIENTQYGEKQKQQVFVEVRTKYKLMHESGESEIIEGFGHGIDSMDKASGKATTYGLKYALLYTFLIPTGEIDDTDKKHSEEIPVKPKPVKKPVKKKPEEVNTPVPKEKLSDERFTKACNTIDEGKFSIERLIEEYDLSPEQLKELEEWKKSKE